MLLIVTGPATAAPERARGIYDGLAAAWPAVAAGRAQPRTGIALTPAVSRLDLLLAALAPAAQAGESGLAIAVPAPEAWYRWVPALRGPLRALILAAFPPGPRYVAPFDPAGPRLARPAEAASRLPRMRTLADELRAAADPAQPPSDGRLWLVTAPPLPDRLEDAIASTFLRAEPFARRVRFAGEPEEVPAWLEGEADRLIAGEDLATAGLVSDLEGERVPVLVDQDEAGRPTSRSSLFDLVSGLHDLYATREVLGPGEAYNRLHSHSGSEELYIVLEGEGVIRVNERVLPIRAGQCFGKPRGYGCATQIVNTGPEPMVLLDVGTSDVGEIDLCHWPEHGELLARFAGHRWLVATEGIIPGGELASIFDRRYHRALHPDEPEAAI